MIHGKCLATLDASQTIYKTVQESHKFWTATLAQTTQIIRLHMFHKKIPSQDYIYRTLQTTTTYHN